jgi:hypothetical protein
MHGSLEQRFWPKVSRTGSCWLWTANRTRGRDGSKRYGLIGAGRRGEGTLYAHRVSWEIHNGPVPEGLKVLHTCDNPQCVRPDHLFLGTQADNIADMLAKGRRSRSGPHPGTGAKSKLTDEQLRQLRIDGTTHTMRQLAEKYGVSSGTVSNILNYVTNQNR